MSTKRSIKFGLKDGPRYGWFRTCKYDPFTFSCLTDEEWKIIEEWFIDTEEKKLIGEAGPTLMSLLQGLIMGNDISRIVQLGHYAGYSSILIGFMLRNMNRKHGLFSIDIDKQVSDYTSGWVEKADLKDYVCIETNDSANNEMPAASAKYLNGSPEMVIIDSSHQYAHTKSELSLWYKELSMGGFLILHDSSPFAESFDTTEKGGVRRALLEWADENEIKYINIYPRLFNTEKRTPDEQAVYKDPCGVTIIQK